MYYERNTDSLWLRPGLALSKKVFRPVCDVLKGKNPQTLFSITWWFYIVYVRTLISLLYSTPSSLQIGRFTFIFFFHWACGFAHSLIFPSVQVRCCFSYSDSVVDFLDSFLTRWITSVRHPLDYRITVILYFYPLFWFYYCVFGLYNYLHVSDKSV